MNEEMVNIIREFNRFYTVWLDIMNKDYLGTDLPWPESRILFEVYLNPGISATGLCEHLNMDKSYVSRILSKFEKHGFLTREIVLGSKGLKKIFLTEEGEKEAKLIDRSGAGQITDKLKNVDEEACRKLCEAMEYIEQILRGKATGGVKEDER